MIYELHITVTAKNDIGEAADYIEYVLKSQRGRFCLTHISRN